MVDDVAGGEHAGQAGTRGRGGDGDVTLGVQIELTGEQLGARVVADRDFGASCESERDTQDSSEYGRVHVPADATACGTRIVVCVSEFGSLAEVRADNPGAFLGTDEAHEEGALDLGDLATMERALADLGYASVPEELLESDHEGSSALEHVAHGPPGGHGSSASGDPPARPPPQPASARRLGPEDGPSAKSERDGRTTHGLTA
ncbi:hypothetical protein GCM10009647_075520 [Streptomyces sanglieri]